MPPARQHSWEDLLHKAGAHDKLYIFNDENRNSFTSWVGHRAIGVVYNPEFEAFGNYVPSQISKRYDAFIHIDQTKALTPIEVKEMAKEINVKAKRKRTYRIVTTTMYILFIFDKALQFGTLRYNKKNNHAKLKSFPYEIFPMSIGIMIIAIFDIINRLRIDI